MARNLIVTPEAAHIGGSIIALLRHDGSRGVGYRYTGGQLTSERLAKAFAVVPAMLCC